MDDRTIFIESTLFMFQIYKFVQNMSNGKIVHLSTGLCLALLLGAGCVSGADTEQELDVPFTAQAPDGVWSEPWQNACEETSIYMVNSYFLDDEIAREEAAQKIREIFAVKESQITVSKDESLETIQELVAALDVPWTTRIVENPTIEDLEQELETGDPIIVPVYARELDNPYYAGLGPDYHVFVLTGYDAEAQEFIVNDPGTQQGEAIRFGYEIFMEAIHDLDTERYTDGRKAVLFTEKNQFAEWF